MRTPLRRNVGKERKRSKTTLYQKPRSSPETVRKKKNTNGEKEENSPFLAGSSRGVAQIGRMLAPQDHVS